MASGLVFAPAVFYADNFWETMELWSRLTQGAEDQEVKSLRMLLLLLFLFFPICFLLSNFEQLDLEANTQDKEDYLSHKLFV